MDWMFTPALAVASLVAFAVYRISALAELQVPELPEEVEINPASIMSRFPNSTPAEKAILLSIDPRPRPQLLVPRTDREGRPAYLALINGRNYFLEDGEYQLFLGLPKAPVTSKL